jgi:hypothetical protein
MDKGDVIRTACSVFILAVIHYTYKKEIFVLRILSSELLKRTFVKRRVYVLKLKPSVYLSIFVIYFLFVLSSLHVSHTNAFRILLHVYLYDFY